MTQAVANVLAAILTIAVLSRVVGNNPLFRAAQYLFVGVSLGLAFVIAYHQVLRPAAIGIAGGAPAALVLYGIPVILGIFFLPRAVGGQTFSWLANFPLAIIFGVGAALSVSGAIVGTLLPQILDSARPLGGDAATLIGTIVLTVATIVILAGFYYTVPPTSPMARVVAVCSAGGHWLLMIAFGFFFAGALQTYLSALTERLQFLMTFLSSFGF
jgi:hypothetical protein